MIRDKRKVFAPHQLVFGGLAQGEGLLSEGLLLVLLVEGDAGELSMSARIFPSFYLQWGW